MKKILAIAGLIGMIGTLGLAILTPNPVRAQNMTWGQVKCLYSPRCAVKPPTLPDDNKDVG